MRKLLIFIIAALAISACKNYDIDEILTGDSEISLSHKGKVIYTFNTLKGQAAYNPDGTLFRYCDDDMQNWFEFRPHERPGGQGEKIVADISWSANGSRGNETGLEFSIEKTDDSGTILMWNSSKNIGLIIMDFE